MLKKLSLQDLPLQDCKVLMRVDFNVPIDKEGKITDDSRIQAALPSIQYVLNQNAKLILMSHLGRPKGKKDPSFSLAPCAQRLSELLGEEVPLAEDCIGLAVEKEVDNLPWGGVILLENLRFHEAEKNPKQDPTFAEQLAKLGDVFVNDAFGACHRSHASITEVPKHFPSASLSGFLLDKEVAFLGNLIQQPKRPYYAILGGAKVSSKVGLLFPLIEKIDGLFIGGAMVYTFLKAQGVDVGKSLVEENQIETAKELIKHCENKAVKLWLPSDIVIANELSDNAETKIQASKDTIADSWLGVDIGPKTIQEWSELFQNAATIFWNGPMGVFEIPAFAKGTFGIVEALSHLNATTIAGGGDSVAAIHQSGLSEHFTHLSTGGGASLQFLEEGHLPGIDALTDR